MPLTRNQILIIGGALITIALFFIIFVWLIPQIQQRGSTEPTKQTTLTMWGTDDPNFYTQVISDYAKAHPKIRVDYKQFPADKYESQLLDAMASGNPPDIFAIGRNWVPRYANKIAPLAPTDLAPNDLQKLYPDIVFRDFVSNKQVYALPLYLDTLAVLYNRDLFNKKGVAVSPTTWGDLKTLIPYFTEFVASRQIAKSAIPLGANDSSVLHASDIFSLILFQSMDARRLAAMTTFPLDSQAEAALSFYLQFASPSNRSYTWDSNLPASTDAFAQGTAAMSVNYSRDIPKITQKNPYLNYSVFPMFQTDPANPVNYADYQGLTVSNQSRNAQYAWLFIRTLATDPTVNAVYLRASHTPPALRPLINTFISDPDLGVFARQSLTATAAYAPDESLFRSVISEMIDSAASGKLSPGAAISQAQSRLNQ